MYTSLKQYISASIDISNTELQQIDTHFEIHNIKKKELLLGDDSVCDFIAFVDQGSVRHFHVKDGNEKTCDISFSGAWVTDFQSFNSGNKAKINLQIMEPARLFVVRKAQLQSLYRTNPVFESFGRLMAERVAQRATDIAMSLSSDKPEERFTKLITAQPDLFQRIPQKHIANFLGISAESLSRIRARVLQKQKS